MDTVEMTPEEIRTAGLEALRKALGPAGMVRFIHQFDRGTGDYTRDRATWLGHPTVDELAAEIEKMQREMDEGV